jgi:hypothetical protein
MKPKLNPRSRVAPDRVILKPCATIPRSPDASGRRVRVGRFGLHPLAGSRGDRDVLERTRSQAGQWHAHQIGNAPGTENMDTRTFCQVCGGSWPDRSPVTSGSGYGSDMAGKGAIGGIKARRVIIRKIWSAWGEMIAPGDVTPWPVRHKTSGIVQIAVRSVRLRQQCRSTAHRCRRFPPRPTCRVPETVAACDSARRPPACRSRSRRPVAG